MRTRFIALGAAAATLAGVATAGAAAAPAWNGPVAISPSGALAGAPAVAVAPRGEAIAAWRSSARGRAAIVVKTRHGLRAPWSPPVAVSGATASLSDPAIALDDRGDAVVVWRQGAGAVRSALRRGWSGTWRRLPVPGAPADAGDGAARAFVLPAAAISPAGAVVMWDAGVRGQWSVGGARIALRGAAWTATPAPPLDPLAASADPPRTALGPSGDAIVGWRTPTSAPRALRIARRTGTGGWGPAVTVADDAAASDVAISPGGRVAVIWTGAGGILRPALIARGQAGATGVGAPEVVPGAAADAVRVAVNDDDAVLAAWSAVTQTTAAVQPADGAWGATLTATGDVRARTGYAAPPAVLAADGTAIVTTFFQDDDSQAHTWPLSAVAGNRAGWGAERIVARGGSRSGLAIVPGGTATVLATGEPGQVMAATYDRAPPVRVLARVSGRWCAARGAVRWTVRIRNAESIAAQGVRLRLRPVSGSRVLEGRLLHRFGTVGRGGTRAVTVLVRPPASAGRSTTLSAVVSAAAMVPTLTIGTATVPRR